jgi:hypothetical protein
MVIEQGAVSMRKETAIVLLKIPCLTCTVGLHKTTTIFRVFGLRPDILSLQSNQQRCKTHCHDFLISSTEMEPWLCIVKRSYPDLYECHVAVILHI